MRTYPNDLINKIDRETRILFEKLFGKKANSEIDITKELNKIVKPIGGFFQRELSYEEILNIIARNNNINTYNLSINEIEEYLMVKKFNDNFDNLSDEDKQKFQDELNKELEKQGLDSSQIKSIGTIGALTAASASGFSMYIMASTIVGGLTSFLGITLPFAFYTGMSSALSVITGPIGWTLGIGYLLYKFKDENIESIYEKVSLGWKSTKNFINGDNERALVVISIICSIRILNNKKINQEIDRITQNIKDTQFNRENLIKKIEEKEITVRYMENQIKKLQTSLNNEITEKQKLEIKLQIVDNNISQFLVKKSNIEKELI